LADPSKLEGWTRWMEVENRRPGSSWHRQFLLLDDSQPERQLVAITAVELDSQKECVHCVPNVLLLRNVCSLFFHHLCFLAVPVPQQLRGCDGHACL
jgi:hypothetical protein